MQKLIFQGMRQGKLRVNRVPEKIEGVARTMNQQILGDRAISSRLTSNEKARTPLLQRRKHLAARRRLAQIQFRQVREQPSKTLRLMRGPK